MAIQLVGSQTSGRAGSTSTSTVNFALTGGLGESTPKAGDLVIITIACGTQARTPTCAVSGYTALTQLNATAQTQDTSMNVSYKFMGGTPDTSFTAPSTGNVQDAQSWAVMVFRGVDPWNPLDVTSTSATGTGTTRADPASITPSTAGAWPVVCAGGGAATASALTFADLTNVISHPDADTNDSVASMGTKTNWTSGAFNCSAASAGDATSTSSWCAYTLALKPAPLMETDTQDFNGGAPGGRWGVFESDAVNVDCGYANSRAYVAILANTIGLQGNHNNGGGVPLNLINSSAYFYLHEICKEASPAGQEANFAWFESVVVPGDQIGFAFYSDGTVEAVARDNYVETSFTSITTAWNTTDKNNYRWFRIRVDDTNVYWDTAPSTASNPPSSGDWTNRKTLARSSTAATWSQVVGLFGVYHQDSAGGTPVTNFEWDGFNTAASISNPDINATLAATEDSTADTLAANVSTVLYANLTAAESSTPDTWAATAQVKVSGTLAATESGADTIAGTATVLIAGSLAATETGSDTLAATAQVKIAATLTTAESATADTYASTATVTVTATVAASETGVDVLASTAQVKVAATFAATETGADTYASTGTVLVAATFAASETGADTLAVTSTVLVSVSAPAWTETGSDTFAASVQTVPGGINATFAATEDSTADTLAATAGVVISVAAPAWTETGADTYASSAQVYVTGALAASESATADTWAATAQIKVTSTFTANESGADVASAIAALAIAATAALNETGTDTFNAIIGAPDINATFAAIETVADTLAATASNLVAATLAATEGAGDSFVGTGQIKVAASFTATETATDVYSASALVKLAAAFTALELGVDVLAMAAYGTPIQLYPLGGVPQGYPGSEQAYPLQSNEQSYPGTPQTYPLQGIEQGYPL